MNEWREDLILLIPVISAVIGALTAFTFNLILGRSGGIKIMQQDLYITNPEDAFEFYEKRKGKREYSVDFYHYSKQFQVMNIELLVMNTSATPKIIIDLSCTVTTQNNIFFNNELFKVEKYEEGILREEENKNYNEDMKIQYLALGAGEVKIIKSVIFIDTNVEIDDEGYEEIKMAKLQYINPRSNFWGIKKKEKLKLDLGKSIAISEYEE